MKAKHTPGPWETQRLGKAGIGYWTVWETAWSGKICDLGAGKESEDEANARLIAAAPDLLAALEEVLGEFDADDAAAQENPGCGGITETGGIVLARMAIAKAKGKP